MNTLEYFEKKINTLESKIKYNQAQLDILLVQRDAAVEDALPEPVECCGHIFNSKIALNKHRQTTTHKIIHEPHFRCALCNVLIFDGVSSLEELQQSPNKYLVSNFRKHTEKCEQSCLKCGFEYKTRWKKQSHICPEATSSPEPIPKKAKPRFKVRKHSSCQTCSAPTPSPSPSPEAHHYVAAVSPPVQQKKEPKETPAYTKAEKPMKWDTINCHGYRYDWNTITNKVYDGEFNCVGLYDSEVKIINFDSDISSDSNSDNDSDSGGEQNIKSSIKVI
mgnify:CR=1 FL=1